MDIKSPQPENAPSPQSRFEILRKTALFKDLSDHELELLASRLQEVRVPHGQQLLVQGEPASRVFWLVAGAVHVIVNGEIIAQVDNIQCFGEMSCLVPGSRCSATVTSIQDCTILSVDQVPFLEVLSTLPKLWQTLFTQTSQRLGTSNKRLSEVFAHIPQGFMKLDKSAKITQEYSEKCVRYFGEKNLAGRLFPELLKMQDPKELELWLEIYSTLFADSLVPFNDLTALLTTEYQLDFDGVRRDFLLTYHPSINVQGDIEAVDVGIEDVTELRQLELSNAALHYEQTVLGRIYSDPETFLNMLDLMTTALSDCRALHGASTTIEAAGLGSQIEITMRSVHSVKGLAGVFGLESVARCCDEMAMQIREFETNIAENTAQDLPVLMQGFKEDFSTSLLQLEHQLGHANNLQSKIGETLLKRLKGVVFSQQDFALLKEHVKVAALPQALAIIESAQARDSLQLFSNWNVKVDLLARSLSKKARFESAGTGGSINKDLFLELSSVLVHVIDNALAHGIERPEDREDQGKAREGLIRGVVSIANNVLELEISDDGRGIDLDSLPQRARSKPNVDRQAVTRFEQSGELWRILLLPGFTTTTLVSRHSGYGVGLDSLNQFVLSKAGELVIESLLGEGTAIRIKLPLTPTEEAGHVS